MTNVKIFYSGHLLNASNFGVGFWTVCKHGRKIKQALIKNSEGSLIKELNFVVEKSDFERLFKVCVMEVSGVE